MFRRNLRVSVIPVNLKPRSPRLSYGATNFSDYIAIVNLIFKLRYPSARLNVLFRPRSFDVVFETETDFRRKYRRVSSSRESWPFFPLENQTVASSVHRNYVYRRITGRRIYDKIAVVSKLSSIFFYNPSTAFRR